MSNYDNLKLFTFFLRKIASAELTAADDEKVAGIFIISFIRKGFNVDNMYYFIRVGAEVM